MITETITEYLATPHTVAEYDSAIAELQEQVKRVSSQRNAELVNNAAYLDHILRAWAKYEAGLDRKRYLVRDLAQQVFGTTLAAALKRKQYKPLTAALRRQQWLPLKSNNTYWIHHSNAVGYAHARNQRLLRLWAKRS